MLVGSMIRTNELTKRVITLGCLMEPERVVGADPGIPQMPHPDVEVISSGPPDAAAATWRPKIGFGLTGRQPLGSGSLERLDLFGGMRRTEVLDLARTTPVRVHRCPRRGLPGAVAAVRATKPPPNSTKTPR